MTVPRTILGEGDSTTRRGRLPVLVVLQVSAAVLVLLTVLYGLPGPLEAGAVLLTLLAGGATSLTLSAWWRADTRRREYAEAIIDLTDALLITIDPDGRIQTANPRACEIIGRPEADLLGEHIHDRVISGEDSDASREAFKRVLSGEIVPAGYRSVREVPRPDGTRRSVAWQFALLHDRRGRISGLLLSGEDVTDQLRREARERTDRDDLEQLRLLAQDVGATDDAREPIVRRVRTMLDATFAALAEVDADGVTFTASTDPELRGRSLERGSRSGCLDVLRSGRPLVVEDATSGALANPELVALTGCTAMRYEPVLDGETVMAVIAVGWVGVQPAVDERREQLLALAADETKIALQRHRTLERLETVALTDALTGIANRRAFDAELERAVARAVRDGLPLTLAVLDLNEFKSLNDRNGHDVGDALLAGCAGAWEGELRGGDLIARLGGDEFAAILPNCDADSAPAIVARLHAITPHAPGASIGFATWTGETPHELYQLADRALYRDKAEYRQRRVTDPARVAAVEASPGWDDPASPAVERIAAEARELLGLPDVYVNLVGAEEMRHVVRPAADPVPVRETCDSFCQHVVASGKPFVVADSEAEPLVAGSSLKAAIGAYAGMPLADADGNVIGALCAADPQPRRWEASELRVLDKLAVRVARELGAPAPVPARR